MWSKRLMNFFYLNFGIALMAINIHFILVPNQFAAGGLGGLAIVVKELIPGFPIGLLMGFLNIILFAIGFALLGSNFGLKTIYSSFALSFMVWLLDYLYVLPVPLSEDKLIQLIIGTMIAAFGLVIVFNQNASTGGMDLIGMILNKYFSIDIGKAVLMSDLTISLLAVFVFGLETGLYTFFGVILRGIIIDYLIQQFRVTKEVVIISNKCDQIKDYIVGQLGRGATVHEAKGAFTNDTKEVITIVVERHEFNNLKRYIKQVDKKAFITVQNMSEVVGGF